MSSAPSLSGSHALSSASDEEESEYILRTQRLHWVRTALSAIIAFAAIAVVGCEGHSLIYYHQTDSFAKVQLFLWPKHVDLRPTHTLVATGAIIAALAALYTVVSLLPSPHPRTILLNALGSICALIGLVAAISAVGFIARLPGAFIFNDSSYGETIHSWTCKWAAVGGEETQDGDIISPSNFKRLCVETRVSFVLMCVLIGLETVFGAAAGLGWWLAIGMGKKRSAAAVDFETVTETKS